MKKRILYLFVIIIFIILIMSLVKMNQDDHYWLDDYPISIELENRISGEVLMLNSPSEFQPLLTELKNIKYKKNKAEETWGLGYSITLIYENLNVNYYFATSTHLFITLNDENWREYVIESNENSIYSQLRDRFNQNKNY